MVTSYENDKCYVMFVVIKETNLMVTSHSDWENMYVSVTWFLNNSKINK